MGRQLLADEPAFAAAVAELEPDFVAQVGFSLRDVLLAGEPVVGIERIQPVLVGMQLALTALWRSYGVEPDAVIGHSMGEVTAAVVAGALSPADGLKVIATRSKLMSRLSGQGAMALLELGADEAEKLVGQYPDVTVAVYAAPEQTVIAGPPEQVDAAIAVVDAQGRLARRVEVDVASHHPTVDPILAELQRSAGGSEADDAADSVDQHGRSIRDGAPKFDADYWVVNLRNPVRFSQAVATAAEKHATFVEVSPHPLLSHAINGTLESAKPRGGAQVVGNADPGQPGDADVPHPTGDGAAAVGSPRRTTPMAQRESSICRRRRGSTSATGRRRSRRTGNRPAHTRCWARTSSCPPVASTSSRPMSAPISFPTCSTTRCTASRSCPAPVSARSRWRPPARPSACRRSR